jgi:hypothetical protein
MLPVRDVVKPSALSGVTNGQLPPGVLTQVTGAGGRKGVLQTSAAHAWNDLVAAAAKAGITLTATSNGDFYRSLESQTSLFLQRYSPAFILGRPSKAWKGKTYWLLPTLAQAATPGTSNHGWGLAVDMAEYIEGRIVSLRPGTLAWLATKGIEMGWSAELQSEPWHWRYYAGDRHVDQPAPQPPPATGGSDMIEFLQLDDTHPDAEHFPVFVANLVSLAWIPDQTTLATKLYALGWPPDHKPRQLASKADLLKWGVPVGPMPSGWAWDS